MWPIGQEAHRWLAKCLRKMCPNAPLPPVVFQMRALHHTGTLHASPEASLKKWKDGVEALVRYAAA